MPPRYGIVAGSKARAFTTKHYEILLIGYVDTTMIRNTSAPLRKRPSLQGPRKKYSAPVRIEFTDTSP